MGIMQLIMGYNSVDRLIKMGACQIGLPVKWNSTADAQKLNLDEHEQGVVQKGKIDWTTLDLDFTKQTGDEPEWSKPREVGRTIIKDYDKHIEYLDTYYKSPYFLTNPGKTNNTPEGLSFNPYPPITIPAQQQKNPLNKSMS